MRVATRHYARALHVMLPCCHTRCAHAVVAHAMPCHGGTPLIDFVVSIITMLSPMPCLPPRHDITLYAMML